MCGVNEVDKAGGVSGVVVPAFRARAMVALLGLAMTGMAASGASAESRTISMYHVHTKERITVTYWKDGRFIPSALRKLNWFLRDWRKNKAVRIDPRTIDLIWKLHADLGSKEVIHIISGHRSASTNAMLRRIGRRVARRSRHITGQAIDFRFPDVPSYKVRYLALAYGVGGVGYYGRNGFIHVDTGKVRHWPRMSQRKLASVIRQYRRYIGRGWKRRSGGTLLASVSRSSKRTNFNRNSASASTRPAVLLASASATRNVAKNTAKKARAAAAKATAPASGKGNGKPIPLPGLKPTLLASAGGKAAAAGNAAAVAAVPTPRARPYEVLVLAASRMEVTPASAPATITNFARGDSARDPIGVVIASLPPEAVAEPVSSETAATAGQNRRWPKVMRSGKQDLAVALLNGTAHGVPTLEKMALGRQGTANAAGSGKGDMLQAPLGMTAERLAARDGAPMLRTTNTQGASMFWPGMQVRAVPDRENRPQRVNRTGKGDLLTTSRQQPSLRKAALREGALQAGAPRPISFR